MKSFGLSYFGFFRSGGAMWCGALSLIVLFLIYPDTRYLFERATSSHPYLMGFIKFAVLSIMGEFLAMRIVKKRWTMVKGLVYKMFVWGVVGVMIVFCFSLYVGGVSAVIERGYLPTVGGGLFADFLKAFYISAIMNLTFGPVFMALHRVSDLYIDSWVEGSKITVSEAVQSTDWAGFISFVVGKTIPLFWIPAHTITFMLPDQYKVLFAASLSIVLGLILSYAKMASTVQKSLNS